jgi:hypothetical protein
LATGDYATAQNVACALRLFRGELWYDTSAGVPYLQQILGKNLPPSLIKAQFVQAALTVPGVATAVCFLETLHNRTLTAQVQVTTVSGASFVVSNNNGSPFILNSSVLDGFNVLQ